MYSRLKELDEILLGCKMMLSSDYPECSKTVLTDLLDIQVTYIQIKSLTVVHRKSKIVLLNLSLYLLFY